jgi:type II secretory pathway component PulM
MKAIETIRAQAVRWFSGLSLREQTMVLVLGCVLVGMGYFLMRFSPADTALRDLAREADQARTKLAGMKWPKEPTADASELSLQLNQTDKELASIRARLATLEARFIDPDNLDAVEGLKVQISELARASGVTIVEKVPHKAGRSGGPVPLGKDEDLLEVFSSGALYDRPIQRVLLETSYHNLRRFLDGLGRLSWRVTTLRLQVDASSPLTDQQEPQPLAVTLWLAL